MRPRDKYLEGASMPLRVKVLGAPPMIFRAASLSVEDEGEDMRDHHRAAPGGVMIDVQIIEE